MSWWGPSSEPQKDASIVKLFNTLRSRQTATWYVVQHDVTSTSTQAITLNTISAFILRKPYAAKYKPLTRTLAQFSFDFWILKLSKKKNKHEVSVGTHSTTAICDRHHSLAAARVPNSNH